LSGSHQTVVRQSSGSHQAVNRQSTGSRQAVVRQSTGSHHPVAKLVRFVIHYAGYGTESLFIPNGCLNAYKVKVNIDIFKYQEKVKLIINSRDFFHFSMAY
jgi:hypothetical protein